MELTARSSLKVDASRIVQIAETGRYHSPRLRSRTVVAQTDRANWIRNDSLVEVARSPASGQHSDDQQPN
jgi:hypothetical protein